ncbi:MAG TPA: cardiolipin synthase [Thermodesulfobacteriota bacterium]|nr:cardiolipin synthase [Thermodesulfobacteriota bacterium]
MRKTLLSVFCLLTLLGCASLPTVKDMVREPVDTQKPPKMTGPRGPLSPRESRAIIERLKRQAGSTDILESYVALMEAISGSPLVTGNRVTLLVDGPATYAAMTEAIQSATDHINFETYIFDDDEVGRRFADLLLKKQAEGVQVNLIYDSVGCLNTPAAFFQRLREGGIQALEFNPLTPPIMWRWLTHRDHRKILIVDGKVAFTGGVNISGVYSKSLSGRSEDEDAPESWRDTHVRVEGPAVAEFQKLFLDTWVRQKGPELSRKEYFPQLKQEGKDLVQVMGSTPGQPNRITYMMYLSATNFAEKFIHLTNSYFVPDRQTLKAFSYAASRGVDVKLILPGSSDEKLVWHAGRSHYTRLLKSGVKLFELGGTVLHAKTAVIDGVWSTVGSTNMELWSFLRNDEVNAVILSRDFAAEMEAMFQKDLSESNQVLLEQWKKRPLTSRLTEWFARMFSHWL